MFKTGDVGSAIKTLDQKFCEKSKICFIGARVKLGFYPALQHRIASGIVYTMPTKLGHFISRKKYIIFKIVQLS